MLAEDLEKGDYMAECECNTLLIMVGHALGSAPNHRCVHRHGLKTLPNTPPSCSPATTHIAYTSTTGTQPVPGLAASQHSTTVAFEGATALVVDTPSSSKAVDTTGCSPRHAPTHANVQ